MQTATVASLKSTLICTYPKMLAKIGAMVQFGEKGDSLLAIGRDRDWRRGCRYGTVWSKGGESGTNRER
jgi:hypothetical protein